MKKRRRMRRRRLPHIDCVRTVHRMPRLSSAAERLPQLPHQTNLKSPRKDCTPTMLLRVVRSVGARAPCGCHPRAAAAATAAPTFRSFTASPSLLMCTDRPVVKEELIRDGAPTPPSTASTHWTGLDGSAAPPRPDGLPESKVHGEGDASSGPAREAYVATPEEQATERLFDEIEGKTMKKERLSDSDEAFLESYRVAAWSEDARRYVTEIPCFCGFKTEVCGCGEVLVCVGVYCEPHT